LITDASIGSSKVDGSISVRASLGWRAWLLILSISAALCCFQLGGARSLTEHEIYVAGGAKQMALDHDWFFPKIGDHVWLEKPPLLHWLVIGSAKLLGGFSEMTVRLPSVFAALGVLVIVTSLAVHWFGERVAIFTALVQTTMVYFITYARLAEADMLLAFLIILALFVFVRLHSIGARWPEPHPYLAFLFWELVGLSNMAKGLGFGPVVILTPCAVFMILKHDRIAWRRTISWSGLAFGFVTAVAWPLVVSRQFLDARNLWLMEAARHAQGWAGFQQPWWYYLATALWQLLPWTYLLWHGPGASRILQTGLSGAGLSFRLHCYRSFRASITTTSLVACVRSVPCARWGSCAADIDWQSPVSYLRRRELSLCTLIFYPGLTGLTMTPSS
jgi:4-amino-4-deoxy-L-arabinose transferase-like glycosyltransferase